MCNRERECERVRASARARDRDSNRERESARERKRERVCVCERESGTEDEVDAHGDRVGQAFWDPVSPGQVVPPPFRGLSGCRVLNTSYTARIVYSIYRTFSAHT